MFTHENWSWKHHNMITWQLLNGLQAVISVDSLSEGLHNSSTLSILPVVVTFLFFYFFLNTDFPLTPTDGVLASRPITGIFHASTKYKEN